ncbi:MAG: membrane protein insertion efficiency factor YidD [Scytolyngbya sp. HA4215-MV1]|nr:membrane protein insertion efficiency factor YidD [Scytolyngbya sp. HA4215-MV1]
MSVITLDGLVTRTAISSLDLYQQHLSPRKGFSCPHRLLYGERSCSDYVKQILSDRGLKAALQLAPQRFSACKTAAQTLQAQRAQGGCIVIPCCLPL